MAIKRLASLELRELATALLQFVVLAPVAFVAAEGALRVFGITYLVVYSLVMLEGFIVGLLFLGDTVRALFGAPLRWIPVMFRMAIRQRLAGVEIHPLQYLILRANAAQGVCMVFTSFLGEVFPHVARRFVKVMAIMEEELSRKKQPPPNDVSPAVVFETRHVTRVAVRGSRSILETGEHRVYA